MTITSMKDVTHETLQWMTENFGPVVTLLIVVLVAVLLLCQRHKGQPTKSDGDNKARTTGHRSPVNQFGGKARVKKIHNGDEYNITIKANPAPSPSEVIQEELVRKGHLPKEELEWKAVLPTQVADVELLKEKVQFHYVLRAYVSEPFKRGRGQPLLKHYAFEIPTDSSGRLSTGTWYTLISNDEKKQECCPFHLITVDVEKEKVLEQSPPCIYRSEGEETEDMKKAREIFEAVAAKVGNSVNLS